MRLDGVTDRDGADALRGTVFVVDSEDLPPIDDPDEFYDHQLEGLRVVTVDGRLVGNVNEKCWCRSSAPSSPRCLSTTRPSRSTRQKASWSWADPCASTW